MAKRHKCFRLEEENVLWLENAASEQGCSEADLLDELIEMNRQGTVAQMVKRILNLLESKE